jgi:hypothetical protein
MGKKGQEKRCARCGGAYEADEDGMVVHGNSLPVPLL